jgi:hypothetical protein
MENFQDIVIAINTYMDRDLDMDINNNNIQKKTKKKTMKVFGFYKSK